MKIVGIDNKDKLINCPACGHKVSKKAPTCPHCGHKISKGLENSGCGIIVLIVIAIVIAFVLINIGL